MLWKNDTKLMPQPVGTPPRADTLIKEPSFIEVINNKIYFYSEIEREKTLQLIKNLRDLNIEMEHTRNIHSIEEPIKIHLYINSYGGEVFSGLSVMDEIINSKVPITTIVDGCCASAATLFSVVGQYRIIKPHAFMLIHQISSVFWGKFSELQDEMSNTRRLMKVIKDIYSKYTKIPEKKLDEMLKHDLWFDAKTCLRYGLVDEIGFIQ